MTNEMEIKIFRRPFYSFVFSMVEMRGAEIESDISFSYINLNRKKNTHTPKMDNF